jgi:hypothetical protein
MMKQAQRAVAVRTVMTITMIATIMMVGKAVAQTTPSSSTANIQLSVHKIVRTGESARPFENVGLFEILMGDSPISRACLSKSNTGGKLSCRITCDPADITEITLLVRAPGADKVPGYESPVSVELAQRGCTLDQPTIAFTYKTLELALNELLAADPQIARAVTGTGSFATSSDVFGQLRPFETSAPSLRRLAVEGNPNLERFSRIMRDAEISANKVSDETKRQLWRKSSSEYSTGTRSVLLLQAATRSLGEEAGNSLVTITKDASTLNSAKIGLAAAIIKKQDKSNYDRVLATELRRTTPPAVGKANGKKDAAAIDWAHINRTQIRQ